MSYDVCPAVTDVGGNGAALGPDRSWLMVPSNDTDRLAGRLLSDSVESTRMSQWAWTRVVEPFSLDKLVEQHVALYRGLLHRGRS